MSWLTKLGKRIIEGDQCCPDTPAECCPDVSADRRGPATQTAESIKEAVRQSYADLVRARRADRCGGPGETVAEPACYSAEQLASVPEDMRGTTFGCGNPVAFADVEEGDVVLDIGSGAGLDALLAAHKVGPQGKVIGLDMTPKMIETARDNARRAGVANVEFRLGDAEGMPVEDASCDWIISNCVINLAPDKRKVFAQTFRVLRPGGRLMISDIVTHDLPARIRQHMGAWVGCIGGALEEEEYLEAIRGAGFQDVRVVGKVTYDEESARGMVGCCCSSEGASERASESAELARELAGRMSSVRVSAVKPLLEE